MKAETILEEVQRKKKRRRKKQNRTRLLCQQRCNSSRSKSRSGWSKSASVRVRLQRPQIWKSHLTSADHTVTSKGKSSSTQQSCTRKRTRMGQEFTAAARGGGGGGGASPQCEACRSSDFESSNTERQIGQANELETLHFAACCSMALAGKRLPQRGQGTVASSTQ